MPNFMISSQSANYIDLFNRLTASFYAISEDICLTAILNCYIVMCHLYMYGFLRGPMADERKPL